MSENINNKKSKKLEVFIGVIIIILIFVFAIYDYNSTPKSISNKEVTNSSSIYKMGQTIKMGDHNITIDSLNNTKTIGKNTYTTPNNFAIVKVTLENITDNKIEGFKIKENPDIFTLNYDNSNYAIDFNHTVDANNVHNTTNSFNILDGTNLNPHTKYSFYLVFTTSQPVETGILSVNINKKIAKIHI